MLPKNLLYQTKAESAQARSYKSNLAPQNGLVRMDPTKQLLLTFQPHLIYVLR